MPELSRFHGIVIKMYGNEHYPIHFHAEYTGNTASFDLKGNVLKGDLGSKPKTKLVQKWTALHVEDLKKCWDSVVVQKRTPERIRPLP